MGLDRPVKCGFACRCAGEINVAALLICVDEEILALG